MIYIPVNNVLTIFSYWSKKALANVRPKGKPMLTPSIVYKVFHQK